MKTRILSSYVPCFGTGVAEVDTGLTALKTLSTGIIAAIGYVVLVKSISETATAFQQQDTQGMKTGGMGIAAGFLMAFVGSVLTALGVS